jgi:hypothetical protein
VAQAAACRSTPSCIRSCHRMRARRVKRLGRAWYAGCMAGDMMSKGLRGVSVAVMFFALGCGSDSDLGSGAGGGGNGSGSVRLPPCQLGFDPEKEPDRLCNWLAGGRCYDTFDGACACICPLDHPATCMGSGLNARPGGRVPVSCF